MTKFLIRKLEEINVEVEYVQNAFHNSERSTEVQTALIYISIEKQEYSSVLIEELKKMNLIELMTIIKLHS